MIKKLGAIVLAGYMALGLGGCATGNVNVKETPEPEMTTQCLKVEDKKQDLLFKVCTRDISVGSYVTDDGERVRFLGHQDWSIIQYQNDSGEKVRIRSLEVPFNYQNSNYARNLFTTDVCIDGVCMDVLHYKSNTQEQEEFRKRSEQKWLETCKKLNCIEAYEGWLDKLEQTESYLKKKF